MNRNPVVLALVLFVAVLATYAPVLQNGYVWDDDQLIYENVTLTAPDGLARIWGGFETQQYYPLTFTSFWLEQRLWGNDARGYHVVNAVLHAANAVLVAVVLSRLEVPGAWLVGALFGLHPVCVESVAWASERKNVLSSFFYLSAFAIYLRFAARRSWLAYAAALGLFVCALLAKTVSATLPVALFFADWYRQRRLPWHELPWLAPFLVIGAGFGGLTVWLERENIGAVGSDFEMSVLARTLLAARVLLFYPVKVLIPVGLSFVYPRWRIDPGAPAAYLPLAGVIALVAALLVLARRTGPGPLAAAGFTAATLGPVLGYLNVYPFRFSYVADHFQYLAMIGVLVLVPSGARVIGTLVRDPHWRRRIGAAIASVAVAGLAVLTWQRVGVFRNEETLWRDVLAKNPEAWLAHTNLGVVLAERGARRDAIFHYRRAIALKPDYPVAHNNLANVLAVDERLDEAIYHYREAVRYHPESASARHILGLTLAARGRAKAAVPHLYAAALRAPENPAPRLHLAQVLSSLDKHEAAIGQYEAALALDPDDVDARYDFAVELMAAERRGDAIAQYREVLARTPDHADAHNNLGAALNAVGATEEALRHFQLGLAAAPDDRVIRVNLAGALWRIGRFDDALATLRAGLENGADDGTTANVLAWYLATGPRAPLRDGAEAVRLAEGACAAADDADPYRLDTLAAAYAEAGRFADAVRTAERALERARAAEDATLVADVEQRLGLYRRGRRYREAEAGPIADD